MDLNAYLFNNTVIWLKPNHYTSDMLNNYYAIVMLKNSKYSQHVPGSVFRVNRNGLKWTNTFIVTPPFEDLILLELIEKVHHDELWTSTTFMEKFRERLIFYNLYYDYVNS